MTNKNKHAYLIIAHKSDLTFATLLHLLDDPRNDLYIHMDLKNKSYNIADTEKLVNSSSVYHVQRTNVIWGHYSQINSELLLLDAATANGPYEYYHLLSGEDLPLKSQDEIHQFFKENSGKEFVRFQDDKFKQGSRVWYYHIFQRYLGKSKGIMQKINKYLFINFQKVCHIKRHQKIQFQKGANWFSITDALARYVVSNQKEIRSIYRWTLCADEIFLQTLVHNSIFKESLYRRKYDNSTEAVMRLIDWERGKPYIFRNTDYQELIDSDMMFARKFNSEVDSQIIKRLSDYLDSRKDT